VTDTRTTEEKIRLTVTVDPEINRRLVAAGHAPVGVPPPPSAGIAGAQLKSIVERIEKLEEEKKAIGDDIKDVFAEAKANGFDVKILRAVLRLRKQDAAEREEAETLLDLYLNALGMVRQGRLV